MCVGCRTVKVRIGSRWLATVRGPVRPDTTGSRGAARATLSYCRGPPCARLPACGPAVRRASGPPALPPLPSPLRQRLQGARSSVEQRVHLILLVLLVLLVRLPGRPTSMRCSQWRCRGHNWWYSLPSMPLSMSWSMSCMCFWFQSLPRSRRLVRSPAAARRRLRGWGAPARALAHTSWHLLEETAA